MEITTRERGDLRPDFSKKKHMERTRVFSTKCLKDFCVGFAL